MNSFREGMEYFQEAILLQSSLEKMALERVAFFKGL
jgi:hypothetical protein